LTSYGAMVVRGEVSVNGVLRVRRTGAPWHDLLRRAPPYQTCDRRFREWRSAAGGCTGSLEIGHRQILRTRS